MLGAPWLPSKESWLGVPHGRDLAEGKLLQQNPCGTRIHQSQQGVVIFFPNPSSGKMHNSYPCWAEWLGALWERTGYYWQESALSTTGQAFSYSHPGETSLWITSLLYTHWLMHILQLPASDTGLKIRAASNILCI